MVVILSFLFFSTPTNSSLISLSSVPSRCCIFSIFFSHRLWEACRRDIIKKVKIVVLVFICRCQSSFDSKKFPLNTHTTTINIEKANHQGEPTTLLTFSAALLKMFVSEATFCGFLGLSGITQMIREGSQAVNFFLVVACKNT